MNARERRKNGKNDAQKSIKPQLESDISDKACDSL